MKKNKDYELVSRDESVWRKVQETTKLDIERLEESLLINKKFLEVAEDELKKITHK